MNRTIAIPLAAVLLAGILSAWWSAVQTDRHMRTALLFQAGQVVQTIDRDRILALSGTAADQTRADYLFFKNQLGCVRKAISGCAFIYLMGRRADGTIFFFVDSEPVGSDDESPAGQTYDEISNEDLRAFEEKIALTTGPTTDRWGTWISALVPITDPDTEALTAVLGIDFSARDWRRKQIFAALPWLLLAMAIATATVLCTRLVTRRITTAGSSFSQRIYLERVLAIIAIGSYLSLAVAWMIHANTAFIRERAFRDLVQDKTATIIKALHTLAHTELEALARFFEASEYVSTSEFRDYTSYLTNNPVVRTWAWAQWVPASKRELFETLIRTQELPDFTIWQRNADGQRVPAADRREYFPVVRMTAAAENRPYLGFDLASEPERRKPLETAMQSGLTTCTAPIDTSRETHRSPIIQIYRPIFSGNDAARSRGVALADIQLDALLKIAHPTEAVFLELGIGTSRRTIEPLAVSWKRNPAPNTRLTTQCPIFAFGKTFLVTAHAGSAFFRLYPIYPAWLAAISGLILTTLVASWFGVVHRKREQLELLVDERTRDLKESQERLRILIDTLPALVWLKDPQGVYQFCNKRFERFFGAKEAEIIGKTDYDFVDRETAGFFREKDFAAMTAARACLNEEEVTFAEDGHRKIMETIKTPMVDAQGKITGVLGIARDITERKQAEERLRLSEEKFSKVFTMAPDIIAITRLKDGLIADVNIGFEAATGWKRSEVVGRTSTDIRFWADPSTRADMVAKLTASQEIFQNDMQFRRKDGTLRMGVYSARIISITNERYIIFVMQDVTDSRSAEKERRNLEAQLQQSQKLEAVGVLAGGVAHDFNNMLGAIMGYAEMAMLETNSGDPIRDHFTKILDAAQRSADLTRQLLAFARRQTVAPVVLDLNTSIEGTLKMLRRLIGENIELAWLPSPGKCTVRMDPSQLDQILANLCVNARDAIAGVGKITIKTDTATFDDATCGAYADCAPGSYVRLGVGDNGCGMDQEIQNRVFEPFFTTKEMGRGTGLGLATVYGIVKQNEGFIQLTSEPGIGTTFTICLPRHAADAETAAAETEDAIPGSRGETILMVEDDATLREMGQLMLQRLGYRVLTAATPDAAIRIAEKESDGIELFLTDVVMPEMNGRELADRLLAIQPGIRHLFMSGYTADIIAHQGVLDDGTNFIQKPFTVKDLAVKIRAVLDQESSEG